jgi:hypothetical protein
MRREIVLAARNVKDVVDLSLQFNPGEFATTFVEAESPLEPLIESAGRQAAGMIIRLTGEENYADFLALVSAYPVTCFVFLAPEFPPHAAVAKLVSRNRGTMLRTTDTPVVVVATLMSLMYQNQPALA